MTDSTRLLPTGGKAGRPRTRSQLAGVVVVAALAALAPAPGTTAVPERRAATGEDVALDAPQSGGAQSAAGFHVNAARLRQTLERLSEFGRNPDGGVTRLGFSETDLAAREYVAGLMRDAGLQVRVDPAGNLLGRRPAAWRGPASAEQGTGRDSTAPAQEGEMLPTLVFGSHIDSVPHGGNFDGDVGSLGAVEVVRALNGAGAATRHPLEVVIWVNEEGHHFGKGVFGSAAAAGLLDASILDRRDEDGLTLADWLRRYGQDPARFEDARIHPGALAGYLELHIEQGAVLDRAHVPIGVVEGIVGLSWWNCTIDGAANHAGTTPMDQRHDALAAASRAVLAVRDAVASSRRPVGTVGSMKAEPGARNIIPGRVEFTIDLRDLDSTVIARIWERIERRFEEIAREEHVTLGCEQVSADAPARTDPRFREAVRDAARSTGLATMDLPSGAGHDAQSIARIAPMGMIFVPSRDGISHSPREFTPWDQVANGAEVLYRTILLLDRRLGGF